MSRRLVPCAACLRHVVAAEPACPFCGAARIVDLREVEVVPPRLRRAATMAFAAALVGCEPPKSPSAPSEAAGAAPTTSTTASTSTAPETPPETAPSVAPTYYEPGSKKKPYGAPPVDGLLV